MKISTVKAKITSKCSLKGLLVEMFEDLRA
jgi:hypothetical protein